MNDNRTESNTPENHENNIEDISSPKLPEGSSADNASEPRLNVKSIGVDLKSVRLNETNAKGQKKDSQDNENTVKLASSPEAVYKKTISLMESGAMSVESAIILLNEVGKSGNAEAYVYMGKMYSNEDSEIYNPVIAFGHFEKAASFGDGQGYYHLGLCYNSGLGCEVSPTSAFECFAKGSELGDADCICAQGMCYEFGTGCDVNYSVAARLYAEAAEKDNVTAICNLGGCFLYGHGIPQNKETAHELFKRASELGSDVAECRLGVCLELGEGCEKDEPSALACYRHAAEQGNGVALYRLARCYDKGIGTVQNPTKAFKYYNLSADVGFSKAMYKSAMMSKEGRGTKKDPAAAYKMLALASDESFSPVEYELGNCYLEGVGTGKNRDAALKKYTKAYEINNKNAEAAFKIGICTLKGYGVKKNDEKAFEWFCRGAELGSCSAAYMKGECFFFGVGITQELSVAAKCFEKSIALAKTDEEAIPAIFALAQCLEYGYGVAKDLQRALELYKRVALQEYAKGCYHTGRLLLTSTDERAAKATRVLMLKAARNDYLPAMLVMGIFAHEGRGVPKNNEDAEKWYSRVVKAEIPHHPGLYEFPQRFFDDLALITESKNEAMYRLGMMLATKQTSPQECLDAFDLIAAAAALNHEEARIEVTRFHMHGGDLVHYYGSPVFKGNEEYDPDKDSIGIAMNRLGDSYFDGKTLVNKNPAFAVKCYRIGAELGNLDACYSYGWCLRHGVGIAENDSESLKWLKLAADKGHIHAAYSYGLCCEEGSGTGIKNLREARSYYRKAASAGHQEAAKRYMALSNDQ